MDGRPRGSKFPETYVLTKESTVYRPATATEQHIEGHGKSKTYLDLSMAPAPIAAFPGIQSLRCDTSDGNAAVEVHQRVMLDDVAKPTRCQQAQEDFTERGELNDARCSVCDHLSDCETLIARKCHTKNLERFAPRRARPSPC